MKRFLPFLTIAVFMAACNQAPPTDKQASTDAAKYYGINGNQPDTTGMAAYQAWKAMNELAPAQQSQPVAAEPKTITKVVYVPTAKPAKSAPAPKPASTSANTDVASNSGSASSESTGEAKAEKKTGISKAAKGAVIGGVVGAAGGAVINKNNRVLGAVIGGVVGAAGGYGIGRGMDKKDGRIE
jgi:Glycine zipper